MFHKITTEIVPFNSQYLLNNPRQKEELLEFYCNIWRYDPNFAEYKKCPICHRYFSKNDVDVNNIHSCSGQSNMPHPSINLEEAWTPEMVDTALQSSTTRGKDFFGAIATVPPHNRIVGFVWGSVIDFATLSAKWDQVSIQKINQFCPCTSTAYFEEIASDPVFRGQGIGSSLCKALISWMKQNYPQLPSMLHTHEKSPAYRLFQKSGFQFLARSDQINQGRILMAVKQCSQLTPENL